MASQEPARIRTDSDASSAESVSELPATATAGKLPGLRGAPHEGSLWVGGYAALLTFVTFALGGFDQWILSKRPYWLRIVISEWPIWLTAAQVLGMAAIWGATGIPRTRRAWSVWILSNLWLAGIAWLCFHRRLEWAVYRSAEIGLRVAVVVVWGFVIIGLPVVIRWVWRRRRGGDRRPSLLARWWFSTTLIVVLVEPIAAVLDRPQTHLSFPSEWAEPADGELRVVALGGSTMLGYPYEPKFGIPPVVEWRLRQLHPENEIVVQNLAVAGENLRQAIGRLHELRVRPHALLLYSGHNEFFQDMEELRPTSVGGVQAFDGWLLRSPTANLLNRRLEQAAALTDLKSGGSRTLFDHHIATPVVYQRRLRRFRGQLEQLATFCREEGIAAVWFVPAGSEAGYQPNRSQTPVFLNSHSQEELAQLFEQARSHEAAGEWSQAADGYRAGLEQLPEFAEFHFRLAECLSQLGQFDKAAPHYRAALELDGHPVRANRDYRRAVADVANRFGIPVIDSPALLRTHTPHGILDGTMFHDNVHPTLQAFFLLGTAACDQLVASGAWERAFGTPHAAPQPRLAEAVEASGLTVEDLASGYRQLADTLRWLGRLRYEETRRRRKADWYEDLARRLRAGEIMPGQGGSEALAGPMAGKRGTGWATTGRRTPSIGESRHPSAAEKSEDRILE